MKRLALVAAVAALSAACTPPTDGSGAPAEREDGAAETPATTETAAETPGAPTTEDIQSTAPLTISQPTVAQIEGYWWNNGYGSATFRAGQYTEFDSAGVSRGIGSTYQIVENCQSRTPNADGRGIKLGDDLCYDVVTVENDVLQLAVTDSYGSTVTSTLTRVTGADAAALDQRFAALPPQ